MITLNLSIIKRDGTKQPYDGDKIVSAVSGAAREAGLIPNGMGKEIRDRIFSDLSKEEDTASVEEVQDLVEQALMKLGYHDVARRYILYREQHAELRKIHPDPNAISNYILMSKYARYIPDLGRRENSWGEVSERNRQMHLRRFPRLADEINDIYETQVGPMKALPSMRSLQFGGTALEANHARMYNCSFSHCNRVKFFSELLYLLLSGCGCGYSVQSRHIDQLPSLNEIDTSRVIHYTVGDTIGGWADALHVLILSYMAPTRSEYIEFIYQDVRNKGVDLITTGGKAPGHIPLKIMLEAVRSVLNGAQGRNLRPFEAHRICCFIAEAVLAGGIRRSSLICLFDAFDTEMMSCKTDNWFDRYPELAMSNNSAVFLRGSADNKPAFINLFEKMQQYGEPGFFFTHNLDYGTNPCGEIGLDPIYIEADGSTSVGWSFCNLTEVNGTKVTSLEEFIKAAKAAAVLGTLQAHYTDFPYLDPVSKKIAERDALIGVSITGIMDNEIVRVPENQRLASAAVVAENERIAIILGINTCARATTVKPSGTASLLLGGVGSGHHEHHARRIFRRVTASPQEAVFQAFRRVNPHMCYEKTNGDWSVIFPMEAASDAVLRGDLGAIEFMDSVMSTFENWIKPGTVRDDLTHNVSCTVTVKEDEWGDVAIFAWENRHRIAAMAFMPWHGDKIYADAPREDASDNLHHWSKLIRNYKEVDYQISDSNTSYGSACEGIMCEVDFSTPQAL